MGDDAAMPPGDDGSDESRLAAECERLRAENARLTAELDAIATVCGLAGVGERGQSTLDRVKALSLEFGHALDRAEPTETK